MLQRSIGGSLYFVDILLEPAAPSVSTLIIFIAFLPLLSVQAGHFSDMEVDDIASTAKMVGAAGTNVSVMTSTSSVDQTFKVVYQSPPSYKENDT